METKLARRKILNETGEGLKKHTEHEKGGGDSGGEGETSFCEGLN